jgi:hypothetical protein
MLAANNILLNLIHLRRIKPNSRNLLIGEQPNPSKILLPEDRLSRHRIY